MIVGILGSGAMGTGIAQVAATAGHEVRIFDASAEARGRIMSSIISSTGKLVQKGRLTPEESKAITGRIFIGERQDILKDCDIIIEAIIENLDIKKQVFRELESMVTKDCILATNTSSLSITSIAASLNNPERCIGIHFFNPPVLMPLVEIIPAVQTGSDIVTTAGKLINSWGKTTVNVKDTPGFIVNKVARPFYSEAIRIMEEGIADVATIDAAMTENGFRMGPFTLMDFIGHDVNYRVTESVWKAFYYEPRYKPSLSQLRLLEAGFLGRKTGRGFYDYQTPQPTQAVNDPELKNQIFMRILSMLINEAADTVGQQICSEKDVDLAVTLGVNYPKGLFEWGKELGYQKVITTLDKLFELYHEERYKVSVYLRKLALS
jgi:3-hydroxybutyryl-CoA dehydrogenase